ncbi:MAG: ComEC/Rec2 family competence protein [Patescibacteria group bacterium]
MQNSRVAMVGIGFFVAGIATASVLPLPMFIIVVLGVCVGVGIGYAFLDRRAGIMAFWLCLLLFGVLRISQGPVSFLFLDSYIHPLVSVRDMFVSNLLHALPEPHASYIAGVLVGVRATIPYDLREAFRRTGTSHILALSGYNVTILARALESIFASTWLAAFVIFLFVLATGAASSLVRAAIMGMIVLLAKSNKRDYSAPHALAVAVFLMLAADPTILFGDIGFQLSVAATLGLIYFECPIGARLMFVPKTLRFRDALASTLAAEAATLPIILWYFGFFSLFAPIVNMLVLPTIPAVMLTGFLTGSIGFISNALAQIFAWPTYLFASYQIFIIKFFAGISIF